MTDMLCCNHHWNVFQTEPFVEEVVTNSVKWKRTGTKCTKIFCVHCLIIQDFREPEKDSGL